MAASAAGALATAVMARDMRSMAAATKAKRYSSR